MKTFEHDGVRVEFGVGRGDGHDHLCIKINDNVLYFAHIIINPQSSKNLTVSLWSISPQEEREIASPDEPIKWADVVRNPIELRVQSF